MKIFEITKKELLDEKWSEKYKKSIDCNNPKGFSQKAHCKGRLKEEDEYGMSGVKQLQNKLLDKYKGLKTLFLYASKGVLSVDMIEVNPNERNKGVGSNVMNDIIEYADANNMEIRLNPAIKDERKGTTSRNRLVRFYKSFGFIENTGRNIDYTKKSGSMYRLPKSAEQLDEKTDFSKEKEQGLHGWFARQGGKGKSKGWVDCNTCRDGKCKSCGRKEGEKRSKYPACRPTPSACKTKGKGKSWGKKSKLNEDNQYLLPEEINEILKGYIEAALWTEEERLNDEYGSEHNKVFKDYDEYEDKEDTELDKLVKLSANINNKGIESFTKEDIEPNSLIKAYTDIKNFIQLAGDSIYEAIYENGLERLGTDIWFTRNGHGAGFFDHSYDDDDEKKLIQAGKSLGSVDLYINDNLKLSFSNQHLYEQSKQDIERELKLNEIKNTFKRLLK
jgi:GNAT superfamily N-acetyltransferase